MNEPGNLIPREYAPWLADLTRRIQSARTRAALAANAEQIQLYLEIGRELLARRDRDGWGAKVVDRLAADLQAAFPDMRGFSSRNLKYMRHFAECCPNGQIGQQPAAQLPWFHIVPLLTGLEDPAATFRSFRRVRVRCDRRGSPEIEPRGLPKAAKHKLENWS